MSVGQDILGNVLFPEDTYETGQYQEDGPNPEDKVYNTTVLVEILSIETVRPLKVSTMNSLLGPKIPSFTQLLDR